MGVEKRGSGATCGSRGLIGMCPASPCSYLTVFLPHHGLDPRWGLHSYLAEVNGLLTN